MFYPINEFGLNPICLDSIVAHKAGPKSLKNSASIIFLNAEDIAIGLVFSTGGFAESVFESNMKLASLIQPGGTAFPLIHSSMKD